MSDAVGVDGSFKEIKKVSPRKQRIHKPSKYDVITGEGINQSL